MYGEQDADGRVEARDRAKYVGVRRRRESEAPVLARDRHRQKPLGGERGDHLVGDRLLVVESGGIDQAAAHPVERGEHSSHRPRLVGIPLVQRGREWEQQRVVNRPSEDASDEGRGRVAHFRSLDLGLNGHQRVPRRAA